MTSVLGVNPDPIADLAGNRDLAFGGDSHELPLLTLFGELRQDTGRPLTF